jgi:FSR family fosmidomycin resistance protein-like MFS transporter
VVFPAFLLVPDLGAKLVLLAVIAVLTGGWYAIPKARLYAAFPASSGTAVSLTAVGGVLAGAFPVAVGAVAAALGLGTALWVCLLGPVGLLVLLPSERGRTLLVADPTTRGVER